MLVRDVVFAAGFFAPVEAGDGRMVFGGANIFTDLVAGEVGAGRLAAVNGGADGGFARIPFDVETEAGSQTGEDFWVCEFGFNSTALNVNFPVEDFDLAAGREEEAYIRMIEKGKKPLSSKLKLKLAALEMADQKVATRYEAALDASPMLLNEGGLTQNQVKMEALLFEIENTARQMRKQSATELSASLSDLIRAAQDLKNRLSGKTSEAGAP
jgi:hypothetical protein